MPQPSLPSLHPCRKSKKRKRVALRKQRPYERALRKDDFYSTALRRSGLTPSHRKKRGGGGAQWQGAEPDSWGAEPNSQVGWKQDPPCSSSPPPSSSSSPPAAPHHHLLRRVTQTERFQLFSKKSCVHTLCTDCALNFLTYFIHKQLCICK